MKKIFVAAISLLLISLALVPAVSSGLYDTVKAKALESYKRAEYKSAVKKLEGCISINEKKGELDQEVHMAMADSLLNTKKIDLALKYIDELLEKYPENENASALKKTIESELASWKEQQAEETIVKGTPEALQAEAEALFAKGDWSGAIGRFKSALAADPGKTDTLLRLGQAYYNKGRFDKALDTMKAFVKANPGDPNGHIMMGYCHMYRKNFDYKKAAGCFNEALKINKQLYEVHIALGNIYGLTGISVKAIQSYNQAKAINSTRPEAYMGLADLYIGMKAYDKAVEELRAVLAFHPDSAATLSKLAQAMHLQGMSEDAMHTAKRAIDLEPANGSRYAVMCEILLDLNHDFTARPYIKKGLEVDPDNSSIHVSDGRYWEIQRRFDRAILEYSTALRNDSNNCMAMFRLANIMSKYGNVDKARKENYENDYLAVMNIEKAYEYYRLITEIDSRFPYMDLVRERLASLRTLMAEYEAKIEEVRESYLKYHEFIEKTPPGFF